MRSVVNTVLDVDECQYGFLGLILGQFQQCRRRRYMPHQPAFQADSQDLYDQLAQNSGDTFTDSILEILNIVFNYEFFDLEPQDYFPYFCNFS